LELIAVCACSCFAVVLVEDPSEDLELTVIPGVPSIFVEDPSEDRELEDVDEDDGRGAFMGLLLNWVRWEE